MSGELKAINDIWSVNRYNARNILLEKSYTKYDGELKLNISIGQVMFHGLFLFYAKPKAIEIYWHYAAEYLHLPHIKLF